MQAQTEKRQSVAAEYADQPFVQITLVGVAGVFTLLTFASAALLG